MARILEEEFFSIFFQVSFERSNRGFDEAQNIETSLRKTFLKLLKQFSSKLEIPFFLHLALFGSNDDAIRSGHPSLL
jgi:hypothetical protein